MSAAPYVTSLSGGTVLEVDTHNGVVELFLRTDSLDPGHACATLDPTRARDVARALLAHADALAGVHHVTIHHGAPADPPVRILPVPVERPR